MKRIGLLQSIVVLSGSLIGGGIVNVTLHEKGVEVQDKITARELHIVDDDGNTRISLGMWKDFPAIRLLDEKGGCRVQMLGGVTGIDESAGIQIFSKKPGTIVWLGLEHQYPVLKMHYKDGDFLVGLGVNPDAVPFLLLRGKDGRVVHEVPSSPASNKKAGPGDP